MKAVAFLFIASVAVTLADPIITKEKYDNSPLKQESRAYIQKMATHTQENVASVHENVASIQGPTQYGGAFPETVYMIGTPYGSSGRYVITDTIYNDLPVYKKPGTTFSLYFRKVGWVIDWNDISEVYADGTVAYWGTKLLGNPHV